MRLKQRTSKPDFLSIFTGSLLVIYVIGLLIPILWSVVTSFTDAGDYYDFYVDRIFGNGLSFGLTSENYQLARQYMTVTSSETGIIYNVIGLYIHSLAYSLICAGTWTMVAAVVSYLVARFNFKFSKIVYNFMLVTLCIPIVGGMASELQMLENLGLFDSWIGMFVLKFNFLGAYFLTFVAMFRSIPMAYTEAAKIDGASNLHIMVRIILPQAMNMIVTVFLLQFITYWNDYQIPMLYLPSYPMATYAVYYFMNTPMGGGVTTLVPVQVAGALLMTLPILIVFAVFNKRLRGGVYIGGIKG